MFEPVLIGVISGLVSGLVAAGLGEVCRRVSSWRAKKRVAKWLGPKMAIVDQDGVLREVWRN